VTRFTLSPLHATRTIRPEPITGQLKTNIILIDFENVQPRDLAQLRGRPFKTKVFCGANQTKVPFDVAAEHQPLGPDAEYIKIQGTGPNALDFHIAYYIGRLSSETPGATFHIVSKDKGFDPLIKHLKTQNISCTRIASLGHVPAPSAPTLPAPPDRIQKVVDGLLKRKDSKPATLKKLTAFIKAQLNKECTDEAVSQVIKRLTDAGMKILQDNKVTYPPS
jgi:PIN domain